MPISLPLSFFNVLPDTQAQKFVMDVGQGRAGCSSVMIDGVFRVAAGKRKVLPRARNQVWRAKRTKQKSNGPSIGASQLA